MARYHLIRSGAVENTIEWGEDLASAQAAYPDVTVILATVGAPGWTWDGSTLSPPPPESPAVPEKVTLFQARTQLRRAGLFDAVNNYIEANKETDPDAWEAWNYASGCYRDSALVNNLAQLLGVSSAQMDALFIAAQSIKV